MIYPTTKPQKIETDIELSRCICGAKPLVTEKKLANDRVYFQARCVNRLCLIKPLAGDSDTGNEVVYLWNKMIRHFRKNLVNLLTEVTI